MPHRPLPHNGFTLFHGQWQCALCWVLNLTDSKKVKSTVKNKHCNVLHRPSLEIKGLLPSPLGAPSCQPPQGLPQMPHKRQCPLPGQLGLMNKEDNGLVLLFQLGTSLKVRSSFKTALRLQHHSTPPWAHSCFLLSPLLPPFLLLILRALPDNLPTHLSPSQSANGKPVSDMSITQTLHTSYLQAKPYSLSLANKNTVCSRLSGHFWSSKLWPKGQENKAVC